METIKVELCSILTGNHGRNEKILTKGTTAQELLEQLAGSGASMANWLVRVNRETAPADLELKNGDRVTISPKKVDGASNR